MTQAKQRHDSGNVEIDYWKCQRCNNSNENELNLEGRLHHGGKTYCFDTKKCKRKQRKNKRQGE